jgi:sulfur-oxidizing protein SoxZ
MTMGSIKIRTLNDDGGVELKLLINHPMENGRNRNPLTGELIAAHYIQELTVALNDQVIITIDMGGSMSANPFFSFRLKTAVAGDKIGVRWQDNLGSGDSAETVIAALN